ncbi:MAG TPA: hypothetical protein VHZ95_06615 [Polyangiales bacterium]|jgi:hypothetical protein|nr:hypothetical protein [Polyangiales bacterium]
MSKSRRPTLEHSPVIAVVVIGGPDALIDATQRAVTLATNARVVTTDIAGAATHVARERPFAIVVSEEIYAFDASEFDALARDVRSVLIALPTDGVPMKLLQERLTPLVLDAFREYFRA